jgi:PhnB protein
MSRIQGVPDTSSVVIPRLVCPNPAAEIEFCAGVFGAVEINRRSAPDGTIAHALLTIGPAMIMIEREWPSVPSRAPSTDGSSPVVIFVYVRDVEETLERATAAGARVLLAPRNQFWGDRTAWMVDPSGHVWTLATRIEETTAEERADRWAAMVGEI